MRATWHALGGEMGVKLAVPGRSHCLACVPRRVVAGLPSDVFSFGVLALELCHQLATGSTYYGEGDLFSGGGLLEGLEALRAPLVADPPQLPTELQAECEPEALWHLLTSCVAYKPEERPDFRAVAQRIGELMPAGET